MTRTKSYLVAVHCIAWIIFLSVPALFVADHFGSVSFATLLKSPGWLYFGVYIIIFYLHTGFLFPKLYFGKRYVLYFLGLLLLATTVYYLRPFDRLAHMENRNRPSGISRMPTAGGEWNERSNREPGISVQKRPFPPGTKNNQFRGPRVDIISIILFFLIIALSVTIAIIKRWRLAVEQAARAEAAKAIAELAVLKAQINPHFLFNTLNNIYSLALMKDDNTAESIMKLSNIMRFVTDDAAENFVPLTSETNFISDYIELQRLRLGPKVTLNFTSSGNIDGKKIAPLILISFIENVFKYGISNNEASEITINLKADEHSISFFCRNQIFNAKSREAGKQIGISNTRKRLENLYPNKHLLTITEENNFFSVYLVLQT